MEPIGYGYLIKHFALEVLPPYKKSFASTRSIRSKEITADGEEEFVPARLCPPDTWQGHLLFAVRKEGINLQILKAFFLKISDLEITAQCIMSGEKVSWVPKAITYDEQPLDYALSVKQRRRWTSGTIQVAGQYLGRTWRSIGTRGSLPALIDLGATLLIPAYQVAAVLGLIVSSLAACSGCHKLIEVPAVFLGAVLLNLIMTALVSTLAAGLVLTVEGKWDRRLLKSLALYWLFLLSWVPITLGSFVKKTTVWEEIRHTRNISPAALEKGKVLISR